MSATVLTAADEESDGGCQRKHWFIYCDPSAPAPPPQTKSQGIGSLTHEQIEKVLKGEEGLASPLALGMLRAADAHKGTLAAGLIEAPVGELEDGTRMTCAGVPFFGHADVVIPRKSVNEVEILDWKTTKSIAKWAKTGPELVQTIQMPAYGEWAARRWAVPRIRLTHVYGQVDGKAQPSRRSFLATREEIASRWEYAQTVGRRIVRSAALKTAEEVEANPKACGSFGGCPFRGRCSVGRRTMLEASMGIMSKMKKSPSAAGGVASPGLAAQEPVVSSPPTPSGEDDVKAQLAALEAEAAKARAALGADVPAVGVVPDDAPPSEHPLPEDAQKPKGKGRPKGSKNKPKTEMVVLSETLGPPVDEKFVQDDEKPLAPPPAAEEKKTGFLLEVYVDCVTTFPTTPLHPYLAKICRELCDEHGALDVRCAPSDSHLAFGRWKGYVAERIRQQPPANDSYSLDTRGSEIAEVAADVLREIAPVFVRGIR